MHEITEIERLLDPCSRKHGSNPESREANWRNLHGRAAQNKAILDLIREEPRSMKECSQILGVPFHTISGRGTNLKALGLVEKTGYVRAGSAVLRITGTTSKVETPEAVVAFLNTTPPVEQPKALRPLSPAEFKKQMKALNDQFNAGEIEPEPFDEIKALLHARRDLYGKQ